MAKRIVKPERRRRRQEDPVQEVESQDEDVQEAEVEEEEVVQPVRRERRRRGGIAPVPAVVEEEEETETEEPEEVVVEEAEEEEVAPRRQLDQTNQEAHKVGQRRARKVDSQPVKQRGGRKDRIKTVAQIAEEEAAPEEPKDPTVRLPKSVEILMKDAFITDVLNVLEDGQTLMITRKNATTWEMRTVRANGKLLTAGVDEAEMPKLTGKEYWDEVHAPAYLEFYDDWNTKTFEERVAYAKKNKVKWDEHEDEKISKMRLGIAVQSHLGIEKYKPKYRSSAARRAIKG